MFKKHITEVHDRYIPIMKIGARAWKSKYPADMGIMKLIKVKAK